MTWMATFANAFRCSEKMHACRQVYHELVVLERIHENPEFCPGASLEAITKPPLRWH